MRLTKLRNKNNMISTINTGLKRPSTKAHSTGSSHEILTCTIKTPQFSYAHLELVTDSSAATGAVALDNLQVKAYCTAALRQFLGLMGAATPLDILKVEGVECWVRVPRGDLGNFAAAITAWKGTTEDGVHCLLRIKQCSDWLGAMVGSDGQERLWNS
jgi:ribonuclease P/MRP protein subunit POP8